ncbi:tripartite-type tricarboxylate transporter receptor subunit TctC [Bradyrhizobium sp. AZCC 1678]|uniref:Bug family tripartite tricarboxylate transporter substrate binding protein n=1 Tax=Bradyrhizobium sp. AZCC 1678 TaxID=3117030 RepID=UPI002FF25FBA
MLDRRTALALTISSLLAPLSKTSFAQGADKYPARLVTLVHQYTAGGTTDLVARLIGEGLQKKWGQPFIVNGLSGGGGIVGGAHVANAKPDGYTLLLTISVMSILPAMNKKLPFDVERSFAPVAKIASLPFVIITSKASGITSLEQLIARAKENPDKITCGSVGIGSPHHLAIELFNQTAGITLRHVPYKGAAGVITDLLGGFIDMTFIGIPGVAGLIDSGSVTPIALTGSERSPMLPKTPTVVESGYPHYTQETWYGLVAPAGTPGDVIDKLYRGITEVLELPENQKRMDEIGLKIAIEPPAIFGKRLHDEIVSWRKLVTDRQLELN